MMMMIDLRRCALVLAGPPMSPQCFRNLVFHSRGILAYVTRGQKGLAAVDLILPQNLTTNCALDGLKSRETAPYSARDKPKQLTVFV